MDRVGNSKAICFNCRFIQAGCDETLMGRCPNCGYPLIVNTAPVALAADELEHVFRLMTSPFAGRKGREDLPGITPQRKRRKTRRVPIQDGTTEPLPRIPEPESRPTAARSVVVRKVGRVMDARRPQARPPQAIEGGRPPRRRWLLA